MKQRSHGTSTSSNITIASISSKRDASGWSKWLRPHGGKLVAARRKLGGGRRKPLEPAPGSYAKERL